MWKKSTPHSFDEKKLITARCRNHRCRLTRVNRKGFLAEYGLAVIESEDCVRGVHWMWRRHVHSIDICGDKFFVASVRSTATLLCKLGRFLQRARSNRGNSMSRGSSEITSKSSRDSTSANQSPTKITHSATPSSSSSRSGRICQKKVAIPTASAIAPGQAPIPNKSMPKNCTSTM